MLYDRAEADGGSNFFVSNDQGKTWTERGHISKGLKHNETAWLQLANGDLFAAARTVDDAHLDAFRSVDQGRTWKFERELSLPAQHPASLTRLPDGRILLSYGIRNKGRTGIDARIGDPAAKHWGMPINVIDFEGSTDEQMEPHPHRDGGYPSTVVLPDGSLLTAYYCRGIPAHNRYHVGVVKRAVGQLSDGAIWNVPLSLEVRSRRNLTIKLP